jgi:parallel beta-helix repeat protein
MHNTKSLKLVAVLATAIALIMLPGASTLAHTNNNETGDKPFETYDVYVDDDADPSWYDETHVATFMNATMVCPEGGSIFAYNGTYVNGWFLNKPLTVIGEDPENTIIYCQDIGFLNVGTGDNCLVSSFTFIGYYSNAITVSSTGTTITNCIIRDFTGSYRRGIILGDGAQHTTIDNCTFSNMKYGIYSTYNTASSNTITHCTFSNNHYGIYISNAPNTTITDCTFNNNTYNGIVLSNAFATTITDCTIQNSGLYGIELSDSAQNTLQGNQLSNNNYNLVVNGYEDEQDIDTSNTINGKPIYYLAKESGVTLDGIDPGYLAIYNCTDITIKNSAIEMETNVELVDTTHSTIENVQVSGSSIKLTDSTHNEIKNSEVHDNEGNGLHLTGNGDSTGSSDNTIINCQSYNNDGSGIYFMDAKTNVITECSIYGNGIGIEANSIEGYIVSGNQLFYNRIFDNTLNFSMAGQNSNTWDDGERAGNLWGDYEKLYPDATNNGITWDTPYEINRNNKDRYPLVEWPYIPDTEPPAVNITQPENKLHLFGKPLPLPTAKPVMLGGPFTITAEATDQTGVERVEFTFTTGGLPDFTDYEEPYEWEVNKTNINIPFTGEYTLKVTAYDPLNQNVTLEIPMTIYYLGIL